MVAPYERAEFANQQLAGSVIMYDNRPVYVQEVFEHGPSILMRIYNLPSFNQDMTVNIFDEKVEAKGMGMRLGYCNMQTGAVWCSRIPRRQYSQGLTRGNTAIGGIGRHSAPFDTMIRRAEFIDMIRGIYPSYKEAHLILQKGETPSIAFNRNLCLTREELGYYLLSFKNERVAWGDPAEFKIPKKFAYLKETLSKCGVPLNDAAN